MLIIVKVKSLNREITYYCDKVTSTFSNFSNFFYINEKSLRISMNDHSDFITRISFHFNYYLSIRYIHTSIYIGIYIKSFLYVSRWKTCVETRIANSHHVTYLWTELNEPLEFISVILFIYLFFNSVK